VQHLLCQAEKDWQTIKMLETRLEAAWRRHHSDEDKIQELQGKLEEFHEQLLRMKCQAEPPRPTLSAEAQGDKNFHLEVRDGKGATVCSETVLASRSTHDRRYYQRNRDKILAKRKAARASGHYYYYQRHRERILKARKLPEKKAKAKMKRILKALQERGNAASLDQLGEVFMQRCKSSASREALARLLAASDGSVGTTSSASGSSGVSADAEGKPPSKKMKLAGPSEDGKDDNQE